jgi:hypothetical protein
MDVVQLVENFSAVALSGTPSLKLSVPSRDDRTRSGVLMYGAFGACA